MIENQNPEEIVSSPPPKKKSKKGWIIGAFIVIALVATGLFLKNKSSETNADGSYPQVEALFSAPAYDKIPQDYKVYIYNYLSNSGYLDGTYFMTKIPDRAKRVFAFGDFTDDGKENSDLAVILEKNDFKSSKLVVFNDKGELLFVEDYDYDLPVINSFNTGAKIFLQENKLIPAPVSGLIIQKESSKYVVLYDKKSKKFSSYYQYTDDDNSVADEEYDEGGEYTESEGETEISTPAVEVQKPKTEVIEKKSPSVETEKSSVPEVKVEAKDETSL